MIKVSVIEFAEKRLKDPQTEEHELRYWAAYLDGAKAQKREDDIECRLNASN